MSNPSQLKKDCKDDIGYVAQLKHQNQKDDIICQHIDYMVMCC